MCSLDDNIICIFPVRGPAFNSFISAATGRKGCNPYSLSSQSFKLSPELLLGLKAKLAIQFFITCISYCNLRAWVS